LRVQRTGLQTGESVLCRSLRRSGSGKGAIRHSSYLCGAALIPLPRSETITPAQRPPIMGEEPTT
jgi:hypothetical protein